MLHFTDSNSFPPLHEADEDGLLAVGGELTVLLLLEAYSKGIFPWYNEGEPVLWWSPDPRCVLFPEELKVSKSMQQVMRRSKFSFKVNTAFKEVIEKCSTVPRQNQAGTWINPTMKQVYTKLHDLGYAHSAECWHCDKLVGGLYGIQLGNVFFGESMFNLEPNASKFAFIHYINILKRNGVKIIDCQVETQHLISLGARCIIRAEFLKFL